VMLARQAAANTKPMPLAEKLTTTHIPETLSNPTGHRGAHDAVIISILTRGREGSIKKPADLVKGREGGNSNPAGRTHVPQRGSEGEDDQVNEGRSRAVRREEREGRGGLERHWQCLRREGLAHIWPRPRRGRSNTKASNNQASGGSGGRGGRRHVPQRGQNQRAAEAELVRAVGVAEEKHGIAFDESDKDLVGTADGREPTVVAGGGVRLRRAGGCASTKPGSRAGELLGSRAVVVGRRR
jgi:hypothetical protein